jgi:RHS repeat-associated protein
LTSVTPPITGVKTQYCYYPDGQVKFVARQAPTGSQTVTCSQPPTTGWETTQYTYTLADMVNVVTDPLGNTTTTTYDADDRVQTVTQQVSTTQNRQRTYSYDALSRLSQLSDTTSATPGTILETHAYTLNGMAASFTDANSNTTSYAYDGFDRLDHTTYPDQTTEKFTYDANGNVLQKTTRSTKTIGFTYDALNRVFTKTPQDETAGQVTYGYDLSGRLLQATDGSTTVPYQIGYDTAGRAKSYTDQQGRNTQVQYDGVGNRTQLTWPANTNGSSAYFVTYKYDAMNRMSYIYPNGSTGTPLAQYQWDSLSRQVSITYGDGTSDAFSQYDAADNLQTMTQTYGGADNTVTFSYTWWKNHQRNSTAVNNVAFQYVPPTGTISYGTPNVDNGYPSMNSSISGNASFSYDGNQNMTSDGVNTLTYDVENRLIQAVNPAWGTSTYLYDPLGQRRQKQVVQGTNTVTTQFVLAGGQEIADYNGTGVGTAWVLTVRGAGGLPVASITPSSSSAATVAAYYHHDVMGSTVAATVPGVSGAAVVFTYSDFGAPGAGGGLAYTYAGYRYDTETGLYYVNARYYNPNLGRFLQTDPIGLSGGTNLYAYVGNDPIDLFDPTGACADANPNYRIYAASEIDSSSIRYVTWELGVVEPNGTVTTFSSGWLSTGIEDPKAYLSESETQSMQGTVPFGATDYRSGEGVDSHGNVITNPKPDSDIFQDSYGATKSVNSSQTFYMSNSPGLNNPDRQPVIVRIDGKDYCQVGIWSNGSQIPLIQGYPVGALPGPNASKH